MVRLELNFRDGEAVLNSHEIATMPCDDIKHYTAKIHPGSWYELYTYSLGESSVTLGIGLFEKSCKLNTHKGFLEWNPNKTANDERLRTLINTLSGYTLGAKLKRYDLAHDIPIPRVQARLTKDRRIYHLVQSSALTEYLGVKNTPGYVKVYDKAAESNLSEPLTRIEITCDGKWDAAQVSKRYPRVGKWNRPDGITSKTAAIAALIADRANKGESIEEYLRMFDPRTANKIRDTFNETTATLSLETISEAIDRANAWANSF